MEHGRLPWLTPSELDPEQRIVYDAILSGPRASQADQLTLADPDGRLHGPFNAMLLDPPIGSALQQLGAAIRYKSILSPRARELAILAVSEDQKSNFEWHAHSRLGKAAGLTDDELVAIQQKSVPATVDSYEADVLRVTKALLRSGDLDDGLFSAARESLGLPVIMELIVLVGYYQLLAQSLRVWRTPLPDQAVQTFDI